MEEREFGASIPDIPADRRIHSICFHSCKLPLTIQFCHDVSGEVVNGVRTDSWIEVASDNQPTRYMRLFKGRHSLEQLMRRYAFQDRSGCLHEKTGTYSTVPSDKSVSSSAIRSLPQTLTNSNGVPQFYPTSGNCWYASLCWATFGNPRMKAFLSDYIPKDLRHLCDKALYSRDDAQALRKELWDRYNIGDDIYKPPHMDGQNGFSEFALMAAVWGVPLVQYEDVKRGRKFNLLDPIAVDHKGVEHSIRVPRAGEQHMLALRYNNGDHSTFRPLRVMYVCGVRYQLVSVYMGSSLCGHQIGMVLVDEQKDIWVVGDADCQKDGIGPLFLSLAGCTDFLWAARFVIPVTKFGPNYCKTCPINPINTNENGKRTQSNNDFLYISMPAE